MNWFKREEIKTYTLKKDLNRYQIQVYDYKGQMIYIGVHEGFTFDEACQEALIELKKKVDISRIPTPIKFLYNGLKSK